LKYKDILNKIVYGRKSIVHGDLHIYNILVDNVQVPWVIDYGKTRQAHSVFDLVFLEVFIRRWLLVEFDIDLKEYVDFERSLLASALGKKKTLPKKIHKELRKAYKVISEIRKFARSYVYDPGGVSKQELFDEYLGGLFCISMALLRYYNKEKRKRTQQHILLTASVLCEEVYKRNQL